MNVNQDFVEGERQEQEGATHLGEHLQVLRRKCWLILGFAISFSGIAVVWSFSQNPVYQSSAAVRIDPNRPQVLNTGAKPEWASSLFGVQIQTHVQLMSMYPVLEETARKLNLLEQTEYQPQPESWSTKVRDWVTGVKTRLKKLLGGPSQDTAVNREKKAESESERRLITSFGKQVTVNYIKGSKLVLITVEAEDPAFAARAANTLATVYIQRQLKEKTDTTESAANWFATHLDNLREKVEKSEQALYRYRLANELVDVTNSDVTNQQSIVAMKLAEQSKELFQAEVARTAAQVRYQQIQDIQARLRSDVNGNAVDLSDLDSLTEVLNYEVIQDLRRKEVDLAVQLARLSEKYGRLHPTMIHGKTELKELRIRIGQEIDRVYQAAMHDYQLALAREKAARDALTKGKKAKMELDKHAVQTGILEREAFSNRQLYDMFLTQMSQTNLTTEIKTSNMYLAEAAVANPIPVRPRKTINTMLGLVAGLALGIGMAFFGEYWDRSLKGPKDLERSLPGFLLLGWVPYLRRKPSKALARIIQEEPSSKASESFRYIRTGIQLAGHERQVMSLAITSPGELEGKTTLAVNLSIGFSQLEDTRVVLIDANLHQPSLHHIFRIKQEKQKEKGLIQYLSGEAETGEVLHQTDIPNLAVIPSGGQHPNAAELLQSRRLSALVEWCGTKKIHVIIDTPGMTAFPDALVVACQINGTILVLGAGETSRESAKTVMQQLLGHRIRVLGMVLQKVSRDRVKS